MIMNRPLFDDDIINSHDGSSAAGADPAAYPVGSQRSTAIVPIEPVLANLDSAISKSSSCKSMN